MTHVAYKTAGQSVIDVVSGLLGTAFASSVVAVPLIAQGQVRALAIGSPTRLAQLRDVPTLKELGYGDAAVPTWFGVATPWGTPDAIIARLGAAVKKAAHDPAAIKRADTDGLTLVTGSREKIHKLVVSEHERLGQLVRRLKIKVG
jgi:tripartite-type tricarboxylate transporter receptor subunit TctC